MGLSRARTKDLFNGDRRMSQLIDALWRDPIGDIHDPVTIAPNSVEILSLNGQELGFSLEFELHDPLALDPESDPALYLDEENQIIGLDSDLLVKSFLDLMDTPDSYSFEASISQAAERMLTVNGSKNGISFANAAGANHNFSWLRDACGWKDFAGTTGDQILSNNEFSIDLNNWNSTGWTYENDNGDGIASNNLGNTLPLSQSFNTVGNENFIVEVFFANRTSGACNFQIDGCIESHNAYSYSKLFFTAIQAGIDGLTITPTADFDGGITKIFLYPIVSGKVANQIGYDLSDNIQSYELRFYDTNLMIGNAAGKMVQEPASYNTVLAPYGFQNVTTGYNNLALGYNNTANTLRTGHDNVLIQSDVPSYDTSYYLNIANVFISDIQTGNSTIAGNLEVYNGSLAASFTLPTTRPAGDAYSLLCGLDGIAYWGEIAGGGIESITAGNGMDFTQITSTGAIDMGTPSSISDSTTNSLTSNSHTHAISSGTAASGSVLTANGIGGCSWMEASSGGSSGDPSYIQLYASSNVDLATYGRGMVNYTKSSSGSDLIKYGYGFKALTAGIYMVDWWFTVYNEGTSSAEYNYDVPKNGGSPYIYNTYPIPIQPGEKKTESINFAISLNANDYLSFYAEEEDSYAELTIEPQMSWVRVVKLQGGSSSSGGTGTVTSVLPGNGMDFAGFTTTGTIDLGTPSSISDITTNSLTSTSHTHAISSGAATAGYALLADGAGGCSWQEVAGGSGSGTVTSITAGNGMDFTQITSTGSIDLGTPSSITGISTNNLTSNSHTHLLDIALNDINNVSISSTQLNDVLQWNGTSWVNAAAGSGSSLWTTDDYGIHYYNNIGIGIDSNQSYALNVDGSSNLAGSVFVGGNIYAVNAELSGTNTELKLSHTSASSSYDNSITFYTSLSERWRISHLSQTENEDFVIRRNDIDDVLSIDFSSGAISFNEAYTFPLTAGSDGQVQAIDATGQMYWTSVDSSWIDHANGLYYNAGNVGIGTTPESNYRLDVVGPTYFQNNTSYAAIQAYNTTGKAISAYGDVLVNGGNLTLTNYTMTSSAPLSNGMVLYGDTDGTTYWDAISGGTSPWVDDSYGINYQAGNVAIGGASDVTKDFKVFGSAEFTSSVTINDYYLPTSKPAITDYDEGFMAVRKADGVPEWWSQNDINYWKFEESGLDDTWTLYADGSETKYLRYTNDYFGNETLKISDESTSDNAILSLAGKVGFHYSPGSSVMQLWSVLTGSNTSIMTVDNSNTTKFGHDVEFYNIFIYEDWKIKKNTTTGALEFYYAGTLVKSLSTNGVWS